MFILCIVFILFIIRPERLSHLFFGKSRPIISDCQDQLAAGRIIVIHYLDLCPGIANSVGKQILKYFHDQAVIRVYLAFRIRSGIIDPDIPDLVQGKYHFSYLALYPLKCHILSPQRYLVDSSDFFHGIAVAFQPLNVIRHQFQGILHLFLAYLALRDISGQKIRISF